MHKHHIHNVYLHLYLSTSTYLSTSIHLQVRKELNKRLAVHFFHNLTDHVEHLEGKLGVVTEDVQEDIVVIMEGIMACYKVVQDQGADFPVQQLFSLMHEDHKLAAYNGEKPTFDSVQGRVIVDKSGGAEGNDPLLESMEALERRDAIIATRRPSNTQVLMQERRPSANADTGFGKV